MIPRLGFTVDHQVKKAHQAFKLKHQAQVPRELISHHSPPYADDNARNHVCTVISQKYQLFNQVQIHVIKTWSCQCLRMPNSRPLHWFHKTMLIHWMQKEDENTIKIGYVSLIKITNQYWFYYFNKHYSCSWLIVYSFRFLFLIKLGRNTPKVWRKFKQRHEPWVFLPQ